MFARFTLSVITIVTVIADVPVVDIGQGTIHGTLSSDGSYEKFEGIPYAEPPTGKNRFRAPVTPAKWNGTLYANRTDVQCPQINYMTGLVAGSEDCLVLNVYRLRPSNVTTEKQSVMFFIHGGGFVFGSGAIYGAEFIIKHGVILVTVNYRLGSLGFLCYKTEDIPGNAGLKDQRAALRWVKENIDAFGGDTDSITIFGESAGAVSVEFHTLVDSTEALFHRAIVQSGSADRRLFDPTPFDRVNTVAKMLGANTSNKIKLTEFYQNVDYVKLIETSTQYDETYPVIPTHICVESSETSEPFLTDYPEKMIKSNSRYQVDTISGFNNAEGILILSATNERFDKVDQNFSQYLPSDLCFDSEQNRSDLGKIVRQFYFGDERIDNNTLVQFIDFFTDTIFLSSMIRSLEARLESGNVSMYFYEFDYEGERNLKNYFGSSGPGAAHADELAYLFDFQEYPLPKLISANDQIMIDRMTTMWTNFAKCGNPTPEVTTLLPVKWTPVSSDTLNTLIINLNMTTQIRPLQQRIAFWDIIYKNYGCDF